MCGYIVQLLDRVQTEKHSLMDEMRGRFAAWKTASGLSEAQLQELKQLEDEFAIEREKKWEAVKARIEEKYIKLLDDYRKEQEDAEEKRLTQNLSQLEDWAQAMLQRRIEEEYKEKAEELTGELKKREVAAKARLANRLEQEIEEAKRRGENEKAAAMEKEKYDIFQSRYKQIVQYVQTKLECELTQVRKEIEYRAGQEQKKCEAQIRADIERVSKLVLNENIRKKKVELDQQKRMDLEREYDKLWRELERVKSAGLKGLGSKRNLVQALKEYEDSQEEFSMSYEITCPYCFGRMQDDEVLFRSEKVNQGYNPVLPEDLDDIDEFIQLYKGNDKEELIQKYKDWEFFIETKDEAYETFWNRFGGTTEINPADDKLHVKAYLRRIIDPAKKEHQRYLRKQSDGSYLIRDAQGMVAQIQLNTPDQEICHRRVCRYCHNPLPDAYGKNKVHFASVIGITGAGKTVYISQLLKNMSNYVTKAGLSATINSPNSRTFLEANPIQTITPLPGSTPAGRFQQPLFYQITRSVGETQRVTETFVLYDVAGEALADPDLARPYAPFIAHSDGMIMLLDPFQFESFREVNGNSSALSETKTVLDTIHNIISKGDDNEKIDIPIAVCISKIDLDEVQKVLGPELCELLRADVYGEEDEDGFCKPLFNEKQYAPIFEGLDAFFKQKEPALAKQLENDYVSYAYFAFTALGCAVQNEVSENGETYQYPVGPVLPKWVEEPLLWLFYKMGYIGSNMLPAVSCTCPKCGGNRTKPLPPEDQIQEVHKLFWKERIFVNRVCLDCGYRWEFNP